MFFIGAAPLGHQTVFVRAHSIRQHKRRSIVLGLVTYVLADKTANFYMNYRLYYEINQFVQLSIASFKVLKTTLEAVCNFKKMIVVELFASENLHFYKFFFKIGGHGDIPHRKVGGYPLACSPMVRYGSEKAHRDVFGCFKKFSKKPFFTGGFKG